MLSGSTASSTGRVSIKTPRVIIKTEVPNGYKRLIDEYMINEESSSQKKIKPSLNDSSDDIQIVGEYCAQECKPLNSKSPTKSSDSQGTLTNESQDNISLDSKEVLNKKSSVSETTDTVRNNETSKAESEIHENSVFHSNLKKLNSGKRVIVPVDFPRMSKLVSIFLGRMNTSQDYLNFFHTPVYDYPVGEVREIDPIETIFTTSSLDEEKIVSKRVGRHKINVVERNEDPEDFAENNIQYICGTLQYMRMKIQPDIIPNADNIGTMLRQILKVCFYIVSLLLFL